MSYDDSMNSKAILAKYGTPVQIGVISYRLINITISNPFREGLSIGSEQLLIGHYNDLLNVSCARNGVVSQAGCISNSTSMLWLWQQDLNPGQSMSLSLNVTYSGATYA